MPPVSGITGSTNPFWRLHPWNRPPEGSRVLPPGHVDGFERVGRGETKRLKVSYIPGNDLVSVLHRLFRRGEAKAAATVAGMVDSVIEKANGQPISILDLDGHGNRGVQFVGHLENKQGYLSYKNLHKYDAELNRLKKHLAKDAVVVLGGCFVGAEKKGRRLLEGLATKLPGVEIRGSTVGQIPGIPGYEGVMLTCKVIDGETFWGTAEM